MRTRRRNEATDETGWGGVGWGGGWPCRCPLTAGTQSRAEQASGVRIAERQAPPQQSQARHPAALDNPRGGRDNKRRDNTDSSRGVNAARRSPGPASPPGPARPGFIRKGRASARGRADMAGVDGESCPW